MRWLLLELPPCDRPIRPSRSVRVENISEVWAPVVLAGFAVILTALIREALSDESSEIPIDFGV